MPFTWTVDLGAVKNLNRVDLSFPMAGGSEARFGYLIKGSNTAITSLADARAADWTTIVDQRGNQTVGFTSNRATGKYRYVQIEVTSAVNVHNGNSVADWENGLVEVQVYANTDAGEIAALPTSSLKPGTYTSDQQVTLASPDAGAAIHYTTDGSTPTVDSTLFDPAKPISLAKGTTTIKAIAAVEGKETSGVASWTYRIIDPNDVTGLQDGQTTSFAVTADEGADGLPKTLKAITADGSKKDAAVTWQLGGVDLSKPYTQVAITGTMAGNYTVNATVAVMPKNLVFFIDSGTKPAEQAVSDSAYFAAAKAKLGNQLLNAQSDQKFDEASGWGYTGKVGDPNNSDATMGIHDGNGIDGTGWYSQGSKKMTYSLTLPAGTYALTTGHQEWWTATRNMKVDVTVNGKTDTKDVHVDKSAPHAEAAFDLTLDTTSKVDVAVHEDGAVMAWIGVAKSDASPDDLVSLADNGNLGTAVTGGTTADELIAKLPAQLEFKTRGGQTVKRDVTWTVPDGFAKAKDFDSFDIAGIADGYTGKISYHVEVVPENLVYFIDSGTVGKASPAWNAVKAGVPMLANADASDKQVTDGTWGANLNDVTAYGSGTSSNGIDKYGTALGGEKDGSKKDIIYSLPLDSGTYRFSVAAKELWQGPRSAKLSLTYTDADGKQQTVQLNGGDPVIIGNKSGEDYAPTALVTSDAIAIGSGTVTLTAAYGGTGDAALVSWVAVSGKATQQPVPPTVDKTALKDAVDKIDADITNGTLDESKYTAESWNALRKALDAAQTVLDDVDATQQQVDDAFAALTAARDGLETRPTPPAKADKTALREIIDAAERLTDDDLAKYTPDSVKAFRAALAKAKTVEADDNATQDDVDKATSALTSARIALMPRADTTQLEQAIAAAEKIDRSKYTDASLKAFDAALAKAKAVAGDANVSQADVDAAAQTLAAAQAALALRGDGGNGGSNGAGSGEQNGSGLGGTTGNGSGSDTGEGPHSSLSRTGVDIAVLVAATAALAVAGGAVMLLRRRRN